MFDEKLTHLLFLNRMEDMYGDPGVLAAEGTCLTQEDYDKGFEYCLDRCLPALEEEMLAAGQLG